MNFNTMNNDVTMGVNGPKASKSLSRDNSKEPVTMNNDVTLRSTDGVSLGRIDQYELIRELGGGGFGCVYLARDTVAGIEVAVKGLPPLVRLNKEELENVRKNFALVSRLHHPNIAAALHLQKVEKAIYDDKSDAEKLRVFDGDTLVVMQYAPGVTLSQWRKQFPDGKVPLDKAIEITRQIASALDYAHKERILHRDIKPANVMIETVADGSLTARVLDFGLAAEIRSSMSRVSQSITDTSGTRPYMAPEQWLGREQGKETDLYALAVLFNELVTGKVPFASVFDTGDPVLMMNVVGREEPELSSELSKSIRLALTKALSKKREDRFASCFEFVEVLSGGMARSKTASRSEVARGLRASPRAYIITALVALCFAVGGVWYWQDAKAKEEARIVAEQKAEAEREADEEARRIAEEKAKKEKVEAELKKKEEAARIAAEKDAERNAELEVFRLSSKVQSAHDLIDGESSEIKEFFALEIRAFENDRRAGDDAKQNSKYVIATNFYAQALSSATALKVSVTKYRECKELLPKIELAKERADEVKASEKLSGGYKTAQAAQNAALDELKQKRFDVCMKKGKEAESLFISLRTDVINAVLDIAEGHKDNERWDKCKQEAEKVLSWDANNAKAIELKNDALQHLVPSLKIITTIDGEEVRGAKVKINGEEFTTPLKWEKLEKGASVGPYNFTYTRYGKNYVGKFYSVIVDWLGLKVLSVTLKEYTVLKYDKIQLWEGGPYWADRNIGAEKPEDPGYYFWWGDTVGYKREGDKWVASDGSDLNFKFNIYTRTAPNYSKNISTLKSEGWITSDGVLETNHDAAHVHIGGNWRLPTKAELDDLKSNCDWRWTTRNGVYGYVVRGKGEYASKSIFLPFDSSNMRLDSSTSRQCYWSSVSDPDGYYAWALGFNTEYHSTGRYSRDNGKSVRPVQGFTK